MKIATWNVNSLNVRLPHVLDYLGGEAAPDILALQELKMTAEKFPLAEIEAAGYRAVMHGQKTYNGVAILARSEPAEVVTGLSDGQARVIAATVDGVRVVCCYVVNGQSVGSDKYEFKLRWFEELKALVAEERSRHDQLVVLGDFNVAPRPEDTHDPAQWEGKILCSDAERAALDDLLALGLSDSWLAFEHGDEADAENRDRFTWWDYRAAGFRRNLGLRIDHVLLSEALMARCSDCRVELEPRRWERPSDHAPVVATLD